MSQPKGHVYGFNIKNASGSAATSTTTATTAAKPAIIVDKFQETAVRAPPPWLLPKDKTKNKKQTKPSLFVSKINAPKKGTERGVQKGTGEKPNYHI